MDTQYQKLLEYEQLVSDEFESTKPAFTLRALKSNSNNNNAIDDHFIPGLTKDTMPPDIYFHPSWLNEQFTNDYENTRKEYARAHLEYSTGNKPIRESMMELDSTYANLSAFEEIIQVIGYPKSDRLMTMVNFYEYFDKDNPKYVLSYKYRILRLMCEYEFAFVFDLYKMGTDDLYQNRNKRVYSAELMRQAIDQFDFDTVYYRPARQCGRTVDLMRGRTAPIVFEAVKVNE